MSIQSIKTNVGNRGEYEEVKDMGVNWKRISFGRLLFAGERWMRGSFDITASGSFFEFSVRNAYRSKQEADTFYNYMKRRLEEKYTGGIEDNEDLLRNAFSDSLTFGTAAISGASTYSDGVDRELPIIIQTVLDGKVIGETAYNYSRKRKDH